MLPGLCRGHADRARSGGVSGSTRRSSRDEATSPHSLREPRVLSVVSELRVTLRGAWLGLQRFFLSMHFN